MRIPLDLYQILGVPIQATPEQIEQAFVDRCQQLPRQEYSKAAIAARTQLLQDAHAVLSDIEARTAYDQSIMNSAATDDAGMELQESQLVGALLLLQEQSAYDRIAELGSTYLKRSIDLSRLPSNNDGSDQDVVLAMALANLEAGRECWQQKQFEKAADVLQSGLKLLTQEQLFPSVQKEIELDLYKLLPYQILELLAAPESETTQRQQGFTLLQTMLDQRGGIDGQHDDLSGLSVDDFLRFIQQLRCHLTVQEQQELFSKEAERPSAVASYLLVYALIAKGCSQGQPELIQQANATLAELANRQDIHVEKAMCYLLLGQPGAAIQTLPLSRDQESLEFIHQYSEGAEDLVPGLFLYTERWLQQEIYPYFRDLAETYLSLQHYFNDEQIQTYLNTLTPEPISPHTPTVTTSADLADLPRLANQKTDGLISVKEDRLPAQPADHQVANQQQHPMQQPVGQNMASIPPTSSTVAGKRQPKGAEKSMPVPSPAVKVGPSLNDVMAEAKNNNSSMQDLSRSPGRKRSPLQYRRWFFMAGAVFLGFIALLGLISQCSRQESPVPEAGNLPVEPSVPVDPEPIPSPSPGPSVRPTSPTVTPSPTSSPSVASDTITTTNARQIIETWQTAKAEAMGENYQIEQLETILAEPALSEWKGSSQSNQTRQSYLQYNFSDLKINKIQQQSPTQATVEATVTETAKVFERGQLANNGYTGDTYQVQYELIREQDQWKIKRTKLLN